MLYYDRTDASEGIDVNKISESKDCNNCHYWCYLHKRYNCMLLSCPVRVSE